MLRDKSLRLAGELLQLTGKASMAKGEAMARDILDSGDAYRKFMDICKAQGGFREPGFAPYHRDILAEKDGTVKHIDNRKLAKIAKLAGAPFDRKAGVWFEAPLGRKVKKGDKLFTIYAESSGELAYALRYLKEEEVVTIK